MVWQQSYKYFPVKLSTILLYVHDSLEKLTTVGASFSTKSVIYKFRQ